MNRIFVGQKGDHGDSLFMMLKKVYDSVPRKVLWTVFRKVLSYCKLYTSQKDNVLSNLLDVALWLPYCVGTNKSLKFHFSYFTKNLYYLLMAYLWSG